MVDTTSILKLKCFLLTYCFCLDSHLSGYAVAINVAVVVVLSVIVIVILIFVIMFIITTVTFIIDVSITFLRDCFFTVILMFSILV